MNDIYHTLFMLARTQHPTTTLETLCREWGVQPVRVGSSILVWPTIQRLMGAMLAALDREDAA